MADHIITHIPASSHKPLPWKNGGGKTVQIHASPKNASLENFDWRLSLATVAIDGPFSKFKGIDRTLTVLSGNGITLNIEGIDSPVDLDISSPPYSFPADVQTEGRLLNGIITDLNIMTARHKYRHTVKRVKFFENGVVNSDNGTTIIFAETCAVITLCGTQHVLERQDCLIISGDDLTIKAKAGTPISLIIISLKKSNNSTGDSQYPTVLFYPQ